MIKGKIYRYDDVFNVKPRALRLIVAKQLLLI